MKMAGMPLEFAGETVPGTTNADDGFQIMPVGAAGVGFGAGAGGGLTVWQSVLGTRPRCRRAPNKGWNSSRPWGHRTCSINLAATTAESGSSLQACL
jgi:hypothetical protein